MRDIWRYIHARTVVRVMARLQGPIPDRSADVHALLRRTIEARATFSILQVGAYDGVSNDAVHELLQGYDHVRAVLLEPQAGAYAKLAERWKRSSRVVTLRAALSDTTGERPLYVIGDAFTHRHPFPDQVSSFYRSRVELALSRYMWRPPADAITSVPVPTLDWRTLVARYGRFDFVAIDAEGYDADILDQIDLGDGPPDIILYEHVLLPRRIRRRSQRRLEAHGYTVAQINQNDSIAALSGLSGLLS